MRRLRQIERAVMIAAVVAALMMIFRIASSGAGPYQVALVATEASPTTVGQSQIQTPEALVSKQKVSDKPSAPMSAAATAPLQSSPGDVTVPLKPSIRLKVVEEAGDSKGLDKRIRSQIKDIFTQAGMTVLDPDATSFDADLELLVKGTALSESYSPFGFGLGRTYYTGAEVSGHILYQKRGTSVITKKTWNGKEPIPREIRDGPSAPGGAPFERAIDKSNLWNRIGILLERGFNAELAVKYWKALLKDYNLRQHAFDGFASMGASGVPILLRMLFQNEHVDEVESALQKVGDAATPDLIRYLGSSASTERRVVAKLLWRIRSNELLDHVIKVTSDSDPVVRAQAIHALGFYENPKTLAPLKSALSDPDSEVQRQAVKAFRTKGSQGVDVLIRVLQSEAVPAVRQAAAEALGKLHNPRAITSLIEVLRLTPPPPVRIAIRNALVKFDDPRVVPALITELQRADQAKDPMSDRLSLGDLLKSKTGQDFGVNYTAWQTWWEGRQKRRDGQSP